MRQQLSINWSMGYLATWAKVRCSDYWLSDCPKLPRLSIQSCWVTVGVWHKGCIDSLVVLFWINTQWNSCLGCFLSDLYPHKPVWSAHHVQYSPCTQPPASSSSYRLTWWITPEQCDDFDVCWFFFLSRKKRKTDISSQAFCLESFLVSYTK